MSERSSYAHGTFSWPELIAGDLSKAIQFYTGLFGWEVNKQPMGDDAFYYMFHYGGKHVSAMYEMMPDQKEMGIPTHWLSYVTVDNVDETVARAKSLGAVVHAGPMDVFSAGRMAVLQEPHGAAFALWQAGDHIGAQLVNQHGTLSWNELATRDTAKSKKFYTSLFGWGHKSDDMGVGMTYHTWQVGERMNGGMMKIAKEWGDVPPHWMVYFAVDDCDKAVDKAVELGGTVQLPPQDIPETGRFAVIQDPQGAVFSLINLINPD